MRSISLITSFFILSVSFADDYVLEWTGPDSFVVGYQLVDNNYDFDWDYNNDGIRDLMLTKWDQGNVDFKLYEGVTNNLIWSISSDEFPELHTNAFYGFHDIDSDGLKEAIFFLSMGGPVNLIVINWQTNTIEYLKESAYNLTIYDFDNDGKNELIFYIDNHVEVWGDGTTLSTIQGITQPTNLKLTQNFPNPFNPATTITYEMPQDGNVNVSIYDIKGELVEKLIDGYNTTGKYSIQWKPRNISSGQYFYQISVDGFVQTKKMVLLK